MNGHSACHLNGEKMWLMSVDFPFGLKVFRSMRPMLMVILVLINSVDSGAWLDALTVKSQAHAPGRSASPIGNMVLTVATTLYPCSTRWQSLI